MRVPLFHQKLSGSRAPLLEFCSWMARPDVPWSEDGSRAASLGSALHTLCERAVDAHVAGRPLDAIDVFEIVDRYDLPEEDAAVLERRREPIFAFVRANARVGWKTEARFFWDPFTDTARWLEKSGEHRDYSDRRPEEIPSTLDVFSFVSPTRVLVVDFKSGWHRVADPAKNRQLLTQACAAVAATGAEDVLLVVLYLEDDRVVPREVVLDAMQLAEHRDWVVSKLLGLESAEPAPGAHCTGLYCPAVASCPATMAALDGALAPLAVPEAQALADGRFRFGPVESAEHAAWMVRALEIVRIGMRVSEKSLRAWADANGGIPTGDGEVWRRVEGRVVHPDPSHESARTILERYGAASALHTELSLSWSGIEEAVGKSTAKKIRAAFADVGAVKVSGRVEYKVVSS